MSTVNFACAASRRAIIPFVDALVLADRQGPTSHRVGELIELRVDPFGVDGGTPVTALA